MRIKAVAYTKQKTAFSFYMKPVLFTFLVAQDCTFLLLDEPINHLDIPARARFEQALSKFNGTLLAVIHDRYFIEQFCNDDVGGGGWQD